MRNEAVSIKRGRERRGLGAGTELCGKMTNASAPVSTPLLGEVYY
jgi:hypothetical protein